MDTFVEPFERPNFSIEGTGYFFRYGRPNSARSRRAPRAWPAASGHEPLVGTHHSGDSTHARASDSVEHYGTGAHD